MLVTWELPKIFLVIRFPGASKDKRLSSVFRSMQSFYRRNSVDNRLDTLTMGMLRKTDKKTNKVSAPKLRASAGETRSLIPWSLEIAEALLDKSNTFEKNNFPSHIAIECLLQPAVKRPLEPTRTSYSRTKIPAALCLSLWQRSWRNVLEVQTQAPPLPGAMWIWWVLPFPELDI